jgi:hypothetical protein
VPSENSAKERIASTDGCGVDFGSGDMFASESFADRCYGVADVGLVFHHRVRVTKTRKVIDTTWSVSPEFGPRLVERLGVESGEMANEHRHMTPVTFREPWSPILVVPALVVRLSGCTEDATV